MKLSYNWIIGRCGTVGVELIEGESEGLDQNLSTQWCIFLSQEVRENHGHFVPLTARLCPRRTRDFHARNSNYYSKIYTTEYKRWADIGAD